MPMLGVHNSMQRTALRATADAERGTAQEVKWLRSTDGCYYGNTISGVPCHVYDFTEAS